VAYEQRPAAVRRWLTEEYPAIRRRAQKQRGIVFWGDEAGMRSSHQAGTSYAPKGKTPVVSKSGQRFSLNMISAISNCGQLVFMVVDGRFNTEVYVRFLQKLTKHAAGAKVFLIVDQHPAHKTNKVSQWLEKNKQRIEVFFLPPYAPQLNADEYFNQDLKTNAVGKSRPGNKQELKKIVITFANRKKRNKDKVKKYFHAKAVKYAS
jgi:transposase